MNQSDDQETSQDQAVSRYPSDTYDHLFPGEHHVLLCPYQRRQGRYSCVPVYINDVLGCYTDVCEKWRTVLVPTNDPYLLLGKRQRIVKATWNIVHIPTLAHICQCPVAAQARQVRDVLLTSSIHWVLPKHAWKQDALERARCLASIMTAFERERLVCRGTAASFHRAVRDLTLLIQFKEELPKKTRVALGITFYMARQFNNSEQGIFFRRENEE